MPGKTNELILAELEKELSGSNFVFFNSFGNLKVSDFYELRRSLERSGQRCLVIKNKLARIVFERRGHKQVGEMMTGMSFLATANKDPQIISKTLNEFAKGREENFQLRGALIDGQIFSASYVKELAKLPTKQELHAKVVGMIKSPINGFVLNLRGLLQSLVLVLNAAKDKAAVQKA